MSNKLKLKYNISQWNQLNLNYWGIPKCANTAIKLALIRACNLLVKEIDEISQWVHDAKLSQYISMDTAITNGNRNVTAVRHPEERFVSMFRDILRRPKHFKLEKIKSVDDFIVYLDSKPMHKHNLHFWPCTKFITKNDKICVDHILDIEQVKQNGFLEYEVELVNVNKLEKAVDLTDWQKQQVRRIYHKDFKLLDYE